MEPSARARVPGPDACRFMDLQQGIEGESDRAVERAQIAVASEADAQGRQELVLVLGQVRGEEGAVVGVLDREVDAVPEAEADAAVELLPVPAATRLRRRPQVVEAVVQLRVAQRRRDEREELPAARGPGERQLDLPGGLGLDAGAAQAGDQLVDDLREQRQAA